MGKFDIDNSLIIHDYMESNVVKNVLNNKFKINNIRLDNNLIKNKY